MKRLTRIILASVLTLVLAGSIALAAYSYTQTISGSVTVVPVGEISVSPTSFDWGEVNRGDVITESVTVTNLSDGPLIISADSAIISTLTGYTTTYTLCSIDWSLIAGTLEKSGEVGDSVTANVTFTIDADALAGPATFDGWVVTGSTPTE